VREILAAAEELFAEVGIETATMANIAERAGVAVGTLYNRFADRDALIEALLVARRTEVLEKLDASLKALEKKGFREQLVGFFQTLFTHVDAHRPFLSLVFAREIGEESGRTRMTLALLERLETILKRGHRERLLRRDPERSFAVCMLWAAKGMSHREPVGRERLAPRAGAETLVELFVDGAGSPTP
jgi:AcrR family transcriptional regulator